MKKSEDYKESKEKAYRERVTAELREIKREIKPPSIVQAASTQKVMNMSDSELAEYKARPMLTVDQYRAIPTNKLKDNPTQDEYYAWLTGTREDITPEMVIMHEGMRRGAKNSIGQSQKSSASDERKELARQAYVCTPPTEILASQKEHVIDMNSITELKEIPLPQKKTLFDLFMKWFEQFGDTDKPMSYMEKQEFFRKLEEDND